MIVHCNGRFSVKSNNLMTKLNLENILKNKRCIVNNIAIEYTSIMLLYDNCVSIYPISRKCYS